jgi:hypothetical protein
MARHRRSRVHHRGDHCRRSEVVSRLHADVDVGQRLVPVDKVGSYDLIAQVRNESTKATASLSFTDDTNQTDLGTFRQALADGNAFKRVTVTGSPANQPRMARIRFVAEKEGGFSCIDIDGVTLTYVP